MKSKPFIDSPSASLWLLFIVVISATMPVVVQAQRVGLARQVEENSWRTEENLPKVDLVHLNMMQRQVALEILRQSNCPCGCGMKIAQCLVNDPNCPQSPGISKNLVEVVAPRQTDLRQSILKWADLSDTAYENMVYLKLLSEAGSRVLEYNLTLELPENEIAQNPFDYPKTLQHLIELTRLHGFGVFDEGRSQDTSFSSQIEAIVARQLDLIDTSGQPPRQGTDQLVIQLDKLHHEAEAIFIKAVSSYAQSRGFALRAERLMKSNQTTVPVEFIFPSGFTMLEYQEAITVEYHKRRKIKIPWKEPGKGRVVQIDKGNIVFNVTANRLKTEIGVNVTDETETIDLRR